MSGNGRRLALLIAVDTYDDRKLGNLESPLKDMERLKQALEDDRCGPFEVDTLPNPTLQEARRKIDAFFSGKRTDDTLLLFYSGHGVVDTSGDFYFALKQTDARSPRADSVEAEYVKELAAQSWAQRIVKIFDCCFAEAYAKEGGKGTAAITQEHFDPGGDGIHALFGAAENEKAWERNGESLFAKYIIEALTFSGPASDEEEMTAQKLLAYASWRINEEEDAITVSPKRTVRRGSGEDPVLARNLHIRAAEDNGADNHASDRRSDDAAPAHEPRTPPPSPPPSPVAPKSSEASRPSGRSGWIIMAAAVFLVAGAAAILLRPSAEEPSSVTVAGTNGTESEWQVVSPSAETQRKLEELASTAKGTSGWGETWALSAVRPCNDGDGCEPFARVSSDQLSQKANFLGKGDSGISDAYPILCEQRDAESTSLALTLAYSYTSRERSVPWTPPGWDILCRRDVGEGFTAVRVTHEKDTIEGRVSRRSQLRMLLADLSEAFSVTADHTHRFRVIDEAEARLQGHQ